MVVEVLREMLPAVDAECLGYVRRAVSASKDAKVTKMNLAEVGVVASVY